jgi:hypothetical protein
MSNRDQNAIYILSDYLDGRYYYGDKLFIPEKNSCKYYLGIDEGGKYCIYVEYADVNSVIHMIPLYKYDDPQTAINELELISKWNDSELDDKIRDLLISFINGDIKEVHDVIMGIINFMGLSADPDFALLNRLYDRYKKDTKCPRHLYSMRQVDHDREIKDIPNEFKVHLSISSNYIRSAKELEYLYFNCYHIMAKYNFLRDECYTKDPDRAYLSKIIKDIRNVFGR